MRVLIVEDEERLARNIAQMLKEQLSYAVDISLDGIDGFHMAKTNPYDLIILDLMLPNLPGLEILRRLREKGVRTPILVLTARSMTQDVVRGLDLGCDDYLAKPFQMAELCARCNALIRRGYNHVKPVVTVGRLQLNTSTHTVHFGRAAHVLPAMEYRLLEYLMLRAGQVVSKEEILDHLYDFDAEKFSNVIEVYISALRKRFGAAVIQTLRNQGYILAGEQDES